MSAFNRLADQLATRPGVQNPAALAAAIGDAKYGKAGMAAKAKAGRKRHAGAAALQFAGK